MTLRIVTWNVNSLRQRLDHLARFCAEVRPDLVCLQETKVPDDAFPESVIRDIGYPHILARGQKAYNGVAIVSRQAFDRLPTRTWCGKDDSRYAAVRLASGLEVHNFYVPSGGPVPDPEQNDKFAHKLGFLAEMAAWSRNRRVWDRKLVLVGDLNVAPLEWDVWNHKRLLRSVGHTPIETARMARLWAAGKWVDVPRHFVPAPAPLYSWWGYRYPRAFEKDYGWRLDHVLVTPPLAPALRGFEIFKKARAWDQPSDHVPLILDLE